MELINLGTACDAISEEYDSYPYSERAQGLLDAIDIILKEVPSISAVPLEPLCEYLAEQEGRPKMCDRKTCGSCTLDHFGSYKECWKAILTGNMEVKQ